ncbi:MAG: tetratricopeptide repeat protein, partial [Paludibacteraceae bacterium]|nr:tetratricopeptide repeat protein [Paludibacteraceae bacterium]
MKRFITFLSIVLCPLSFVFAQTDFDAANAAYAEGRYEEAATGYEALLAEGENATLYYNLGNARFKQGELAQAILNYERALRLNPNHKDAKYNLAFAQSRITDNIVEQDFFLSAWVRAIRNQLRERTWVILSIVLFILALVGILLFLLGREPWLRKTAFHLAWIALLFSLIAGLNAVSLHNRNTLRNEAIITQG